MVLPVTGFLSERDSCLAVTGGLHSLTCLLSRSPEAACCEASIKSSRTPTEGQLCQMQEDPVGLTCSQKVLSKASPGLEGESKVIFQPYLGRYSISIACPTHVAIKPSRTLQNIPLTHPLFLFLFFSLSLGSSNEVPEVRVLGGRR